MHKHDCGSFGPVHCLLNTTFHKLHKSFVRQSSSVIITQSVNMKDQIYALDSDLQMFTCPRSMYIWMGADFVAVAQGASLLNVCFRASGDTKDRAVRALGNVIPLSRRIFSQNATQILPRKHTPHLYVVCFNAFIAI